MQYSDMKVITFAIFSIFLGILGTNADYGCPDNWVHAFNSCYQLHKEKVTWQEAATKCRTYYGGHLIIIDNKYENWFLTLLLMKNKVKGDVWLDATDKHHEGTWVWVDEYKALDDKTYQNWEPYEPNNYGHNEHCLAIGYWKYFDNDWNDIDCHRKEFFVCEKPSKYWVQVHE